MKKYKNRISDYLSEVSGLEGIKYEHDMLVNHVELYLTMDKEGMLTADMRKDLDKKKTRIEQLEDIITKLEPKVEQ